MATHSIMDITTTIPVPKTEYEELVKDSTRLKSVKEILTSEIIDAPNATIGVLRIILGLEEGGKDETKIIGNDYAGNCYHIESDDD